MQDGARLCADENKRECHHRLSPAKRSRTAACISNQVEWWAACNRNLPVATSRVG